MAPLLVPFLLFLLSFSFPGDITPKAELVLGRTIPNVELITPEGSRKTLSEIVGDKPALISFIYTRCTSSCPLIIQRLKESLEKAGIEDYRVVLVDFDERDLPANLRSFIAERKLYDPRWSVVMAKKENLRALAGALDFKFFYDEKTDMFAHPNVLVVLSPSLKVTGYVLGLSYNPTKLNQLVENARLEKVDINPIRGLLLKCFRYDPVTGTYSVDWSFVTMLVGGLIPIAVMFYYVVLKNALSAFRRATE